MSRPSRGQWLLLTAFGLGASPIMPGTVGSLGTAALIFAADSALGAPAGIASAALLLVFGSVVTLRFGGIPKSPEGHGDPGWVVSDEVAGQALASLAAVLVGGLAAHALAFLLFRVFDIAKPGLRPLERIPGGLGVLLDDIGAGVIAGLLVGGASLTGLLPA